MDFPDDSEPHEDFMMGSVIENSKEEFETNPVAFRSLDKSEAKSIGRKIGLNNSKDDSENILTAWSREGFIIEYNGDPIAAVGKWDCNLEVYKTSRTYEKFIDEILYFISDSTRLESFILQERENSLTNSLLKEFKESIWRINRQKGDLKPEGNGEYLRVIPDKPVGMEFRINDTSRNFKRLGRAVRKKINQHTNNPVEVYVTQHNDEVNLNIPFKNNYEEDKGRFARLPGEEEKHHEFVEAVAEILEENGYNVERQEEGNIVGYEVENQRMIKGSQAYKTREAGRNDGSNVISRPWK